jgi:exosortase A
VALQTFFGGAEFVNSAFFLNADCMTMTSIQDKKTTYVSAGLALLCLLVFYFQTWKSMALVWSTNETYSHGFLILPISVWLVWRDRERIFSVEFQSSPTGFLLVFLGLGIWLLGALADVNVVQQFGAVFALIGLIPSIFGWQFTKSVWFPLGFLLFMIPGGEFLVPPLMSFTADVTVWSLQLSGIPVFRENMHFTLPTGRWSVVEACSGLRYVIAALVLACLFSYLNYKSWNRRAIFTFCCLAVAIVANWVRAYTVVLVGHWSDMKYGTGDDHIYYGWVFFGVVMVTIFWLGNKYRDVDISETKSINLASSSPHLEDENQASLSVTHGKKTLVSIVSVLVCLSLSLVALIPSSLKSKSYRQDLSAVFLSSTQPLQIVYTSKLEANSKIESTFKGTRGQLYGKLANNADYLIAYYAGQTDGQELVQGANSFLPDDKSSWKVLRSERVQLQIEGAAVTVEQHVLQRSDSEIGYFNTVYCVAGRCAISPYLIKAFTALSALLLRGDHSVAIAHFYPTSVGSQAPDQKLSLQQFAELVKKGADFSHPSKQTKLLSK